MRGARVVLLLALQLRGLVAISLTLGAPPLPPEGAPRSPAATTVRDPSTIRNHTRPLPDGAPRCVSTDGTTTTWTLPLRFSSKSLFWRNFTVDAPEICRKRRCAVLVDFHPYESNSREEREWMRWFIYQREVGAPFVLVTPDGSGDVLTSGAGADDFERQGWNVLGWGVQAAPAGIEGRNCKGSAEAATCLDWAVHKYRCYSSQMELNAAACSRPHLRRHRQLAARRKRSRSAPVSTPTAAELEDSVEVETSNSCATMSAQDDALFMARTLRFVVDHFRADARRIYFSGQSQGAMAALALAAPDVLPFDLQPAAVVAASAGAARSHTANLSGQVRVLLMHGSRDDIVPPTVWSGVMKNTSSLRATRLFRKIVQSTKKLAGEILMRHLDEKVRSRLKPNAAVLLANTLTGGHLLRKKQKLLDQDVGCRNSWGDATAISLDGFLYDPFSRTLAGVAGREVNMSGLHFKAPPTLPLRARRQIQCADVPSSSSPSSSATVTVCIYDGGHCFPWQNWASYDCDWTRVSRRGRVFHDFVWRDFLLGGAVSRSPPGEAPQREGMKA